jgi:hypothetical protein
LVRIPHQTAKQEQIYAQGDSRRRTVFNVLLSNINVLKNDESVDTKSDWLQTELNLFKQPDSADAEGLHYSMRAASTSELDSETERQGLICITQISIKARLNPYKLHNLKK